MSINTISPTTFTSAVLVGDLTTQNGVNDIEPTMTVTGGHTVSAALEIQSSLGALLLPRMTTGQMNALTAFNGMMIYNLTANAIYAYENGAWGSVITGDAPATATYILKTVNASLPNAQSLGALTNGILTNTVVAATGTLTAVSNLIDTGAAGNFFIGTSAGNLTVAGTGNVGMGYQALTDVAAGGSNTSIGYQALPANTDGNDNSAFGLQALQSSTVSGACCAFGVAALQSLTTGNDNSAFGFSTLDNATNATNTSAFGANAGIAHVQYTNCTFLGYGADTSANNLTNATAVGYNAVVGASNSLVLGASANVGIGTSSPVNKLHIVGTYQQKGITAGWTGTDVIKGQGSLQTTDATPTNLLVVAIPSATSTTYTITGNITVMETNGTNAASSHSFSAGVYNSGAGAVIIGAPTIAFDATAGINAIAADWVANAGNLELQVTGIAATTLNWVVSYEHFGVTVSTA